jgi:LEA14-like dessication related protein
MKKCLGIFSLLIISVFLISCLNLILEKPSFVIREINLGPISLTETNLLLGVEVCNPNHFNLTINHLEYTVYLKGKKIGKGGLGNEYLVSASSTTQIQMPIHVKFKNLGGGFSAIITGEDVPYKIEGNAGIKTAFGSSDYPFSKEGHINLKNLIRSNA